MVQSSNPLSPPPKNLPHSHVLLYPNPRVIFVSQQRLIHSSAQSSTSQEFVISRVPQVPTAVIAPDVGGSTLVSSALSSQSTNMPHQELPTNLFLPTSNKPTSSVNVERLRFELQGYPDQSIADYLINGFRFGFDIGYTGPRFPWVSKNLVSSISNSLAISQAIQKELSRGHIAGHFKEPPFPNLHCSPLGAVPKKDGSYRLIIASSSPPGKPVIIKQTILYST